MVAARYMFPRPVLPRAKARTRPAIGESQCGSHQPCHRGLRLLALWGNSIPCPCWGQSTDRDCSHRSRIHPLCPARRSTICRPIGRADTSNGRPKGRENQCFFIGLARVRARRRKLPLSAAASHSPVETLPSMIGADVVNCAEYERLDNASCAWSGPTPPRQIGPGYCNLSKNAIECSRNVTHS